MNILWNNVRKRDWNGLFSTGNEHFDSITNSFMDRWSEILNLWLKTSIICETPDWRWNDDGGSGIMVWRYFGDTAAGDWIKIDSILCKKILEENAVPNGQRLCGKNVSIPRR